MDKPIRMFEGFAGYGSTRLAMNRLIERHPDFRYDVVGISEISDNALKAYKLLHGDCPNYGDISKIDWKNVPDFDLLTYSFPCFVAGTIVEAIDGFYPIEDIKTGQPVVTHTGEYHQVTKVMKRLYTGKLYHILTSATETITCTDEHPFYVCRLSNRKLGENPEWVKAKDLDKDCWLCVTTNNEENDILVFDELPMYYLYGMYIGCGHIDSDDKDVIVLNCNIYNIKRVVDSLTTLKIDYIHDKFKIKFKSPSFTLFGAGFSATAPKQLAHSMLRMPKQCLEYFMHGLIHSIGEIKENGYCEIKTSNRILAYNIFKSAAKLYGSFTCIKTAKQYTYNIDKAEQADIYIISFTVNVSSECDNDYDKRYKWVRINSITTEQTTVDVYNLEVETDNSYTANGVAVHNCQSISQAGLKHGFAEGTGTRSSLLWECRKAIKEKMPRYLLMENVKAILNNTNMENFNRWIVELASFGYKSWYKCINSVDHGVPQLRERVYMVSILDDGDKPPVFEFPVINYPYKTLKDIMEENVDKSYYLDLESRYSFRRCKNEYDVCELLKLDCEWRRGGRGDAYIEKDLSIRGRYSTAKSKGWHSISERVLAYENNPAYTLTTTHTPLLYGPSIDYRVREMTEREVFRIMDVDDKDIDKIINAVDNKGRKLISKTQCTFLAGNSICVNVLTDIYEQIFYYKPNIKPLF